MELLSAMQSVEDIAKAPGVDSFLVDQFLWGCRMQHGRAMPQWEVDSTMVDQFLWGCRRQHGRAMPQWEVDSTLVDQFLWGCRTQHGRAMPKWEEAARPWTPESLEDL